MMRLLFVALALALGGCASTRSVLEVPREVLVPVLSCPAVEMPPLPILATPTDRTPAEVVRAALIQLEQLQADNSALRGLLAPYTFKRTDQGATPMPGTNADPSPEP